MALKDLLVEFKAFLVKTNAIALGIAIVLGLAIKDLVDGVVACFIQPIIDLVKVSDGPNGFQLWIFQVGAFIGILIKFVLVMWVVFMLAKLFIKEEKKA